MPTNRFHDEEIAITERAIKRLHAHQQAEPSHEFMAKLERALGTPVSPSPVAPSSRRVTGSVFRTPLLPEHVRSRRRPLWAGGAIAIALLVVAASLFTTSLDRKSDSQTTTAPMAAATIEESQMPEAEGIRWTVPAVSGTTVGSGAMALGGDILYRATSSSIQAILKSTGTPLWETQLPAPRAIAADESGVFISSTDSDGNPLLIGLDSKSGTQIWSVSLPNFSENVIAHSGLVIAQDWANHVTKVDAKTGEMEWQTSIGPDISDSERQIPQLIATADAVFAISSKQTLNALDLETGEVQWSVTGVAASQTAVSDDTIAVIQSTPPDYGNTLVAYSAANGSPLWQRTLDNPVATHPGVKLIGGSSWFAFISSDLGELIPLGQTPLATPLGNIKPWMTASSASIFSPPPTISVLFIVRAKSGYLDSVSRWTDNLDPQSEIEITSLNSSAITVATSDNERGILILCQNGRVGWYAGYGATGESFQGVRTKSFNGGAVPFPHDLPGISFNVALADDSGAYIMMRDGSLIAIDANPVPTGNG